MRSYIRNSLDAVYTESTILDLVNISNSFEYGEFKLGIFIDFSKARSALGHIVLLNKLK